LHRCKREVLYAGSVRPSVCPSVRGPLSQATAMKNPRRNRCPSVDHYHKPRIWKSHDVIDVRLSVRGLLSQATAMKKPRRNRRLLAKARSQMPSLTIVKGAPLVL